MGVGEIEALRRRAADLRRLAAVAGDGSGATDTIAGALVPAWGDAIGREWSQRLRLVHRELARLSDAAAALARAADRDADELAASLPSPGGARLGGQDGTYVTGAGGVVVPTLPPPVR